MSRPTDSRRALTPWLVVVPLLLAFLAHSPALRGGLVWDDVAVVEDQLPRFEGLRDVLLPPAEIAEWAPDYYRPVVVLSYLLDVRLLPGNADVAQLHLSNILWHVAATFFVWVLARRVFRQTRNEVAASLFAAALFAVHPIHTESVNWIAGRSDVLATLLLLPALVLLLRWRDSRSPAALLSGSLLFLLALLAKEVAIAGLVLLPAAWVALAPVPASFAAPPTRGGGLAVALAAWGAMTVLYLILRQAAGVVTAEAPALGPGLAAIALPRATAWYALKSVVPWPQSNFVWWDMLPGLVVALLILLVLTGFGALAFRAWRQGKSGLPLFIVVWWATTLAPSLWIALGSGTSVPVAERYLYLPTVAVALAVGWALSRAEGLVTRRVGLALAIVVVAGYLTGAVTRGAVWSSNVRLWSDAVAKAPDYIVGWHNLARAFRDQGDLDQALAAYERGLGAQFGEDRARAQLRYGMGEVHLARGDLAQAEREFQNAQHQSPTFSRPAFGLGLVNLLRARAIGAGSPAERDRIRSAAADQFWATLARTPKLHEARMALAELAADRGEALERDGKAAAALGEYRLALAELAALETFLPGPQLQMYLRRKEPGVEKDVATFRRRVDAAISRLEGSGGGAGR